MNPQDLSRLQSQARWLRRGVTALLVLLGLAIALSVSADLRAEAPSAADIDPLHRAAGWLAFWSPGVFYLWALWAIRRVLGDVAQGRHLQPALARALRHVGLALAAGAFTSALIRPNLMRLMDEAGWGGRGGHPFASYLHFDEAYAAVGTVGLALVLLSRVLRAAADLRTELDEII